MISLVCGIKTTNEQTKRKQTHRYREHFDGCQMGEELGRKGEKGRGLDVQIGN